MKFSHCFPTKQGLISISFWVFNKERPVELDLSHLTLTKSWLESEAKIFGHSKPKPKQPSNFSKIIFSSNSKGCQTWNNQQHRNDCLFILLSLKSKKFFNTLLTKDQKIKRSNNTWLKEPTDVTGTFYIETKVITSNKSDWLRPILRNWFVTNSDY